MKANYIYLVIILLPSAFVALAQHNDKRSRTTSPIAGVWYVEQFAFRYPDSTWTPLDPPHKSLYIFTNTHYGYSYTRGSTPRKKFSGDANKPMDAEKVTAYDSFVSNMGTYTIRDSTLVLTAVIHKNPNEMSGEPVHYKMKLEKNRLKLITSSPPFFPGREWRTILVKLEELH